MSDAERSSEDASSTFRKQTVVNLSAQPDGTWEATQDGLDVIGAGDSAPRAVEDMARQIAEDKESGGL